MIITIEGKAGEGKTTLAREIFEGRKVVQIQERALHHYFGLSMVDKDTEVIFIDNVRNLKETHQLLKEDFLEINYPCKDPITIETPDIILVKS